MSSIKSNVKVITSGNAPTTENLPSGNIAFGKVGGQAKLYGNIGTEVISFGGDGAGSKILYFADEDLLDSFTSKGEGVPTGEWYAATAEELYGDWSNLFTGADLSKKELIGSGNLQLTKSGNDGFHMSYQDYTLDTSGANLAARSRVEADVAMKIISVAYDESANKYTIAVQTKYTNFKRVITNTNGINLSAVIHIYNSDERTNEVFEAGDNVIQGHNYNDVSFTREYTVGSGETFYASAGRYYSDVANTNDDDEFIVGVQIKAPTKE